MQNIEQLLNPPYINETALQKEIPEVILCICIFWEGEAGVGGMTNSSDIPIG